MDGGAIDRKNVKHLFLLKMSLVLSTSLTEKYVYDTALIKFSPSPYKKEFVKFYITDHWSQRDQNSRPSEPGPDSRPLVPMNLILLCAGSGGGTSGRAMAFCRDRIAEWT